MTERFHHGLDAIPEALCGGVLAIGNFDGVHRGHQRIVQTARELAGQGAGPVLAMTFDPPPDVVIRPNDKLRRLTPHKHKCELLAAAGADAVVTARATRQLLGMEPDAFAEQVIARRLAPRHVVEGPNFRFGRRRAGDVAALAAAGERLGFEVHVVEPVFTEIDGEPWRVSSTRVRELIAQGRIEAAARCLGRPYALYGPVLPGAGQGRLLSFPTANIDPPEQIVPADGVYAGIAEVGGGRHAAAVSIGNKPTLGPAPERVVEAFLLDGTGDYYGQELKLELLARVRDQERFRSAEQLSDQIAKDVARVRDICRQEL